MRKIFILLFAFHSYWSFSQDITGDWQGSIDVNNQKLPVVFHFYKNTASGQLDGKWESPAQHAKNLPFSSITSSKDSVKIGIKLIEGSYEGKMVSADSIAGIWRQSNVSFPLNLKRFLDTSETSKKNPYPNEKEISITSSAGSKISGTLLSKNNRQKIIIIIAGSGPTDRNGNNIIGDVQSYKLLAHALDSQDIATFRFDKRGVGASIPSDFKEGDLVFDDYVKDAEKIFKYLHDTLSFSNIYFAGHSEGSLIGMIASQKEKVKGFISIAGAGRPIDEIIEEQAKSQGAPDSIKNKMMAIFSQLKKGKEVNDIPPSLAMLFRKSVQPYMISWLKYSPASEIRKLSCPILILQGSCDKQVKIIDAENLHDANKKSTIDIIPLMTHTLKNTDAGCKDENNKTYTDGSLPVSRQLVNDIVNFIKK